MAEDKEYTKLCDLLAAKEWVKADDETARLITIASGKDEYKIFASKSLNEEDISKIPCECLQIIDELWMRYSNNKFGFTIQIEQYLDEVSNCSNFFKTEYDFFVSLSQRFGWRGKRYDDWVVPTKILYSEDLPKGFFPRWGITLSPSLDSYKTALFIGNCGIFDFKEQQYFQNYIFNLHDEEIHDIIKDFFSIKIINLFFSHLQNSIINNLISINITEIEKETNLLNQNNYYTPKTHKIAQKQILTSIAQRRGQPKFREGLQIAYNNCCAITGCDAEQALEAAHIIPYCKTENNDISNGLLLRADIHTLFDLNLIAIEPETHKIHLARSLHDSSYYDEIKDKYVILPENKFYRPKQEALEWRWRLFDCNS